MVLFSLVFLELVEADMVEPPLVIGVVLEKLKQSGVVSGVIDNFDMTFPWHFDNRCNDGVHYGRAPAKMKWRDGQIGHQYFVDLMLAHVLLNALCAR